MSENRSIRLPILAALGALAAFGAQPALAQTDGRTPASAMSGNAMAPGGGTAMKHGDAMGHPMKSNGAPAGTMAKNNMSHDAMAHGGMSRDAMAPNPPRN